MRAVLAGKELCLIFFSSISTALLILLNVMIIYDVALLNNNTIICRASQSVDERTNGLIGWMVDLT